MSHTVLPETLIAQLIDNAATLGDHLQHDFANINVKRDQLRDQAEVFPAWEPGRTLAEFESRDWLTPYLISSRIVGNLKLVTTTTLVEEYRKHWVGRFDDKTFAVLVLEAGEALQPVSLRAPERPYHINEAYPFFESVNEIGQWLTITGDPHQIYHLYYRPDAPHGVFKIELNKTFLKN